MSEEKKPTRTIETIQQEYSALAAQAGQNQYQVYLLKKDAELMNKKLQDLNFEAAALKVQADKDKAAADAQAVADAQAAATNTTGTSGVMAPPTQAVDASPTTPIPATDTSAPSTDPSSPAADTGATSNG